MTSTTHAAGGQSGSYYPSISADGRLVAYESKGPSIVPNVGGGWELALPPVPAMRAR